MRLMTAHRILIGSAAAFFGFLAYWSLALNPSGRGSGAPWLGAASGMAALGLAAYLARIWRRS